MGNKTLKLFILALSIALTACFDNSRDDTEVIEPPPINESVTVNHFLRFINTQASLAAGEYVIVVATKGNEVTDDYQLTIDYDDGTSINFSGSWISSGGMDHSSVDNPTHPISLAVSGGLKVTLTSTADNYLYLTRNGHIIAEDDDSAGGSNAQMALDNSKISSASYANAYYQAVDPNAERTTLSSWKTLNGFDNGADQHLTFRDRVDLGYGRDMYAKTRTDGGIAIYIENYVVQLGPGDASTYGPLSLNAALTANQNYFIGNSALEYSPIDPNDATSDKIVKMFFFNIADENGQRSRALEVDPDGRGFKAMPTPCFVCHGGKPLPLNPDGSFPEQSLRSAKMNILDTEHFTFSKTSGHTEQALQPAIKAINQLVHSAYADMQGWDDAIQGKWNADFAIELDTGAYAGDFSAVEYDKDFIPIGWQKNGNRPDGIERLYKEVIKPHCAACHSLLGTNSGANRTTQINNESVSLANAINLSNYEQFISYSDLIIELVYRRGQMPLSLLNYTTFWRFPEAAPTLLASFLPGFNAFDGNGNISPPQVPVAILGENRTSTSPVSLNASASILSETFSWKLLSSPSDATGVLSNATGISTVLTADKDGDYTIELTASNEAGFSDVEQTVITINSLMSPTPQELTFSNDIQPIISACSGCHRESENFAGIAVYFNSSNLNIYQSVLERVDLNDPASSLLLFKATTLNHGGGIRIKRDTVEGEQNYQTLLNWITHGAPCGDDPIVCS
ncbi:hypothetical protein CXF85_02410 [Colwellia sp. 75C3]|uniref:hypothetical protein n=1 Tax=Colwellia sp. 75C3 TaxID=888425 RepID=UPI000C31D20F|nr:hypothetical protein [Colwellia sp. 75C3]PKG85666.1 hypothetical protein CXF85_02410 [Colwellia sp. 75C3]